MKQLQWDKLPQQQVVKTVFNEDEPQKEQEWVKKLQSDGVWMEMEEDFKAKQLVINLMGECFVDINSDVVEEAIFSETKTGGTEECP